MLKSLNRLPKEGEDTSTAERLDTWKEIASYLNRDVRTVSRWEKEEGLPVHRHLHHRLSSVYAYRSEIDEWWRLREGSKVSTVARSNFRKRAFWWLGLLCLTAIAVTTFPGWRNLVERPAASMPELSWILISDFENRTGNPLLNGSLEYALRIELASSRLVRVVSRPRVEDTLRLMRKPLDSPINVNLGKEVCLRDGDVRVLVAGSIERLGDLHRLTLRIIDPMGETPEESLTQTVRGEAEILEAVPRLSEWLRRSLGEIIPKLDRDSEQLYRVTTSSLKALRLFSIQDRLARQGRNEAAVGLLKAALAEDPEFAAAYAWLAYALLNTGRPKPEVLECVKKAVDFSRAVTEWERYHIYGAYYELHGDLERALPYWEALCERYPDEFWGYGHLRFAYGGTGRIRELTELTFKIADLRPNDYPSNFEAFLAAGRKDPFTENPYLERLKTLESQDAQELWPGLWAAVELFDGTKAWIENEPTRVIELLEAAWPQFDSLGEASRNSLAAEMAHQYLRVGRIATAEHLAETLWGVEKSLILAEISLAGGRPLEPGATIYHPLSMIALARQQRWSEAEELLAQNSDGWAPFYQHDAVLGIVEGEIALARGDRENGIRLLEESLSSYEALPYYYLRKTYFLGAEALAKALRSKGQFEEAAELLERVLDPGVTTRYAEAAFVSLNLRWLLATTYRELGKHDRFEELVKGLQHQLQHADHDHPILISIQASVSGDSSVQPKAAAS